MNQLLKKNISPRSAVLVMALVLAASVVTGREEPDQAASSEKRATAGTQPGGDSKVAIAYIDAHIEQLNRPAREGTVNDLFAIKAIPLSPPPPAPEKSATSSPQASTPPPPPKPVAPPLPFRYVGRMMDKGKAIVFVARNDSHMVLAEGDVIEGTYKVESIEPGAVVMTYLPLDTKQTMAARSPN